MSKQFIDGFVDSFGGVPPQTRTILERLLARELESPVRETLQLVEEELELAKRSTVAVRSLTRLAEALRAKLPAEEVQNGSE
jgi:hypothetical protein